MMTKPLPAIHGQNVNLPEQANWAMPYSLLLRHYPGVI